MCVCVHCVCVYVMCVLNAPQYACSIDGTGENTQSVQTPAIKAAHATVFGSILPAYFIIVFLLSGPACGIMI